MLVKTDEITIDLKKFKTFWGHEGERLHQAEVVVDGKPVCFYSDGDWGGPPVIRVYEGREEDYEKLKSFAESLEGFEAYGLYFDMEIEIFIPSVLMTRRELRTSIRRSKRKVFFRKSGQDAGEYSQVEMKSNGTLEGAIKHIKVHYPDALIANEDELAFMDAVIPLVPLNKK